MSDITQIKAVFEGLAGRVLTNAELDSVIANYNASWNNEWFTQSNPYDQQAQPTEWAAWPDNATPGQLAAFALQNMRKETKARLKSGRGSRFERTRRTAEESAANEI